MHTKTTNEFAHVRPLRLPPLVPSSFFFPHPLNSSSLPAFTDFQTLSPSLFLLVLLLDTFLMPLLPRTFSLLLFSLSLLFPPVSLRLLILCSPSFDSSPLFFLFLWLLFVFCLSSALSSFASPFSPALSLLRLYFLRHCCSLSSSLVFLYLTLLLPVT